MNEIFTTKAVGISKNLLTSVPDIRAVLIFGSVARDEAEMENSDIDLSVVPFAYLNWKERDELYERSVLLLSDVGIDLAVHPRVDLLIHNLHDLMCGEIGFYVSFRRDAKWFDLKVNKFIRLELDLLWDIEGLATA